MANSNVYRTLKDVYDGRESYAVYSSSGVPFVGDMCQWDPTALVATQMTTASGAIFLGVSEECQPLAGLGSNTNPLTGNMIRIVSQGLQSMNSTTGETYTHRVPVYMGADPQTISVVGAGRIVGRVHLPDGSTITGAAGTRVPINICGSMTNGSAVPSASSAAQ